MSPFFRALTTTLFLLVTFEVDLFARQLLERSGVELRGNAELVLSDGGTCRVLESDTSYEARKGNHGAPMDIWRLDFSVHNRSGRWLDHLIARFRIESVWPECTNWDGPEAGRFSQPIEWAGSIGTVQKSGRNVVAPGQTLTHTKLFIVLRGDPQPRFANWSMNFDFAADTAPAAGSSAPVPKMSAEQDMVFWQSIMNSTDPADFEAYLRQFPLGVFRALAQNRLAALDAPGSDLLPAAAVATGNSGVGRVAPDAPDGIAAAPEPPAGKSREFDDLDLVEEPARTIGLFSSAESYTLDDLAGERPTGGIGVPSSPSDISVRQRVARIDFDMLTGARGIVSQSGSSVPEGEGRQAALVLNLFNDRVFTWIVERTAPTSSGYSLSGRLMGVDLSSATFVVNGRVVAGTVRTPRETYWIRSTREGNFAITQVDLSRLPDADEPLRPPEN